MPGSARRFHTYEITLGGLLLALFFLAGNVLPPLYLVPNVPVTLQILVVALMGGLLGVRAGLLTLSALYLATLAGLPMMAQFHAGPAAFAGPTGGYIFGWAFLVLLAGLARPRTGSSRRGRLAALRAAGMAAAMAAGVLLDYACGALWLDVYTHAGAAALPELLLGNLAFLPFDLAKCVLAAGVCALPLPALRASRRAG